MMEEIFKLVGQLGRMIKFAIEDYSSKTNVITSNKTISIGSLFCKPEESLQ
jgi:hypothetical protein